MFFSQSKPNIDSVIPAMDYIDQQLTNSALNPKYSKSIKTAISLGKRTLNRYYDMTDHSEIYQIAMGKFYFINSLSYVSHHDPSTSLTPRHKLNYFKKAGWNEEWITAARQIVRDEFERSYAEPLADADEIELMVCVVFLSICTVSSSNLIFSRHPQSHSTSFTVSLPSHLPRQ